MGARELVDNRAALLKCFPRKQWVRPGLPYVRLTDEETGAILTREQLAGLRIVPEIVRPSDDLDSLLNVVRAAREQQVGDLTHNERVVGLAGIRKGCAVVRPQRYLDFLETNGASGLTLDSVHDIAILTEATKLWSWLRQDADAPFQEVLIAALGQYPQFASGVSTHTIGVGAIMRTSDGWYLPVQRDAAVVGVNTEGLNIGPAGGVQWEQSVGGELLIDRLHHALAEEAVEECGLLPAQYTAKFLGGVRELPRGGSPEFFFLMELALTRDQMMTHYAAFDGSGKKEARAMVPKTREEMLGGRDLHSKLRVAIALTQECRL